jgi:peptide/nickel transport system permease protein
MTRFLVRRIGQAIAVVFIVSIMTFLLLHLLPGGAARAELGVRASPGSIRAFNKANGYNLPLVPQYFLYLDHLFHGKLGYSYKLNEPVSTLLAQDLPKSFYLSGLALFFTLIIAIPLGIYQAVRRNKPDDYLVTGMSFIGYSMPTFWLGLLLIAFFSIFLKWLPPSAPQSATVGGAITDPRAMILPVLTLTIVGIAFFSRAGQRGHEARTSLWSHVAQRDLAGRDADRSERSRFALGESHYGVRVQLSRGRPLVLDGRGDARLSDAAGADLGGRDLHRDRQPPR